MLDPESRVLFRQLSLNAFIRIQDAFNCEVAVGVRCQLPACCMRLLIADESELGRRRVRRLLESELDGRREGAQVAGAIR